MAVVPDALPRRERERLARRQAMLDAARAVFAEKGYEQATLDEVAERAEFGKGTLYNYFDGGKEGILRALMEDLFDDVEGIVSTHVAAYDERPVRDLFHDLLAELMGYFEANRDTFLLVIKEAQRLMLSPGGELEQLVWERDDRLAHLLEGPITHAMAAGHLRPLPPLAVARTVFGNMHGLMMHHFCHPKPGAKGRLFSAQDAAGFITTVLFDGLRPRD